jgi:MoaA/NifB/PqqE/SkfB family radical SAM enzyme
MALLAHALHPSSRGRPRLRALFDVAFPCNLACEGCPRGRRSGRPGRAAVGAVAAVADELADAAEECGASAVSLVVYGGEPLLDVDAIAAAGARVRDACARRGAGYDAALITNATLLDGGVARRLARSGFGTLQVNVPAPRPDGAGRVSPRGGSPLERALENTREARDELALVVRCEVASAGGLRDALGLVRLLEDEGILDPPRPATVVLGPRISYAAQARALLESAQKLEEATLTRCP